MSEAAAERLDASRFAEFYQFICTTRVIAGRGLVDQAGFEFIKEGAGRVLLVTDEVIRGTGLAERVGAGVTDGGLELTGVFDGVPQDSDNLLGPRERDGAGKPLPLAPLAAIPTTAGTGSEASWAAVVKDRSENLKFQIGDFTMFPDVAILDPAATETLPAPIAAATGMDALTHAIEGYVSSERSGAIGITHSMSHPCGGHFNVAHGVANAINLPWVIEYNAAGGEPIADRYRTICEVAGVDAPGGDEAVGKALADHVRGLSERLGLPSRLSEVGVPEDGIPALVEGAIGDGCTLVNPREPTEEDFAELYAKAL